MPATTALPVRLARSRGRLADFRLVPAVVAAVVVTTVVAVVFFFLVVRLVGRLVVVAGIVRGKFILLDVRRHVVRLIGFVGTVIGFVGFVAAVIGFVDTRFG